MFASPSNSTAPTPELSADHSALLTAAGYDVSDEKSLELGQMALHCAGLFFETGTVEGSPPARNSPCPCGSGKKYKKCCRNTDEATAQRPKQEVELHHIPQLFNDDAMDMDQDLLHNLLATEPHLAAIRYDPEVLDQFMQSRLPAQDADLDAQGWSDAITLLAQQFHVEHGEQLDVVGALLHCGRSGEQDPAQLRALANGVLHLALTSLSEQPEMNLVAAEIFRVTAAEAEAAGRPLQSLS